jgi:hypothetical protein
LPKLKKLLRERIDGDGENRNQSADTHEVSEEHNVNLDCHTAEANQI